MLDVQVRKRMKQRTGILRDQGRLTPPTSTGSSSAAEPWCSSSLGASRSSARSSGVFFSSTEDEYDGVRSTTGSSGTTVGADIFEEGEEREW